ncbi:MAG: hypothetical protein ACI9CF_001875 [Candidatus Omnitrophota bacterium]|jgi:hypothetical protein
MIYGFLIQLFDIIDYQPLQRLRDQVPYIFIYIVHISRTNRLILKYGCLIIFFQVLTMLIRGGFGVEEPRNTRELRLNLGLNVN